MDKGKKIIEEEGLEEANVGTKKESEEVRELEENGEGKENIFSNYLKRIEELEAKLQKYQAQEAEAKEELNRKFITAIQKKSAEAAELIKSKEEELEKKYIEKLEESKKFVYESQLTELVNIVSRMESVVNFSSNNREIQNYLSGFKMFLTQFENLFESWNIKVVSPGINEEFDSEVMESVETTSVERESQKNKVLRVISKGYTLNDRVIKLAQVQVGV